MIVALAAATNALLSDGRFVLGVGSGERLNEHVVGQPWPSVTERHERFREALEIIRLLWSGGYHSYEGKHLRLEDACRHGGAGEEPVGRRARAAARGPAPAASEPVDEARRRS